MSIELGDIGSGFNRSVINTNFTLIQEFLNDVSLKREVDGDGEANEMRTHLDMNHNEIVNVDTDVDNPSSVLTVGDADERYVNISGDEMESPLSGPASTSSDNYMPQVQIVEVIDNRMVSAPEFDPENFQDYGLITASVSDQADYGSL